MASYIHKKLEKKGMIPAATVRRAPKAKIKRSAQVKVATKAANAKAKKRDDKGRFIKS